MPSSSDDVVIRLLGRFEVTVAGRTVDEHAWSRRRPRELVQLLALADRRRLLRDQVIDALWPHLDAEAGGANLRKAAHHARQVLGDPGGVVLRGGEVVLFPGRAVRTDVDAFRAAAGAAAAGGERDACAAAADRYGGELLPESRYEEWTQAERARLHSELVAVLRAGQLWSRLVEAEPTDEEAHRELMAAALETGARSEAVRWYAQLRDHLANRLGVAPSPETQELFERCVRSAEPPPALLGRDVELAVLTAALAAPPGDRPAAIVLAGSAGVGKTALCRELARFVEGTGRTTVQVAVTATATADPYGPVRQLVELVAANHRGAVDAIGDACRQVLALLTPVAGPLGDGATVTAAPTGRHQFVGAVRRLLLASAAANGLLLVVDDVHEADTATLDLLAQLVGSDPALQILLTHRPGSGNDAWLRHLVRLTRTSWVLAVDVVPLRRADAEQLVRAAAEAPLDPADVARVVELAAGNPFALREVARSAGGGRALQPDVAAAITARLVNLDDGAMDMLRRIALVGGDVDSTTALALGGEAEPDALARLDAALEAGALVVVEGRYRFQHDLVRLALVDQVPPHQRAVIQRDVASRLAAVGAPAALVGRSWLAGGRPAEAVEPLLDAARSAVRLGAMVDALAHLAPVLAHDPEHTAALRLRAEALDVMGAVEALRAYDDAIEAADQRDAHDLRAKRALAQLKQGDVTGALRALDGITPSTVDGRLAAALTYSGAAALGFTDPTAGTEQAAACRRLALETGDRAAIVVASWAHAAAAHARGELRESVLTDLRETHHLPDLAVRVFDGQLCVTQRLLYGARPYDDVIEFADALTAEATRLGAGRGHAFGVTLRGEAELLAGRLDEAERDLSEGVRLHRAIAGPTGEALALQRLSEVAMHRGDRSGAQARLDEALDVARTTDIGFHLLDRIYGARIAMATDPEPGLLALDEAEEAVRGGLETCPGCRITLAVPAAIAAARGGDLDRARDYGAAVEFLAERVMRLPAWTAALTEVRAHLARASGGEADATDLFTAAAKGFAAAGHPLDAARCAAEA